MLGKIIGGVIGAKAARNARGTSKPTGALMGAASVAILRRFGLRGIVAAAAGGYALKRYQQRRDA